MKPFKTKVKFKDQDVIFNIPEGDDCGLATAIQLKNNVWNFDDVKFEGGDVFVDLGSNVGVVSLGAAKAFPYIRILSFDPNPIAIDCLRQSCIDNHINNIEFFNVAVGGKAEKNALFWGLDLHETCLVQETHCKDLDKRKVRFEANKISICDLFDNPIYKINRIKLLKIDIEGGEFEMFSYIFKHRPEVLNKIDFLHLEIHAPENSQEANTLKEKVKEKFGNRLI